MTLNLLQLSRAFNLFVGRQFRVCVRYSVDNIHVRHPNPVLPLDLTENLTVLPPGTRCVTYHHSFTGFQAASRNFNNIMNNPNSSKGQVRAAHTGNKSGYSSEFPPLVTNSVGNKGPFPQVKDTIDDPGKTSFSKEKMKICRPRMVSSSANNIHTDFKLKKLIKLLKEQQLLRHQKNLKEQKLEQKLLKEQQLLNDQKLLMAQTLLKEQKLLKQQTFKTNISGHKKCEIVDRLEDSDQLKIGIEQSKAKNIRKNQLIIKQDQNFNGIQSNNRNQLLKVGVKPQTKSADDKNLEKRRLDGDLLKSISTAAKDMVEWLDTVRKHLAKLEQPGAEKSTDYMKTSRLSDGKTPKQRVAKKVDTRQSPLNLPLTKTEDVLKSFVNRSQELTCKGKVVENVPCATTMSGVAKDLDKINQDIGRLRRERNAVKDSKRLPQGKPSDKSKDSEELLEIRPTYVEDIDKDVDVIISKKTNLTKLAKSTPTMTVAQMMTNENLGNAINDPGKENCFILADKKEPQIVENTSRSISETTNTDNEKGFIMIATEFVSSKETPYSLAMQGDKGNVMVNNGGKTENLTKRSKQENVVFVNDNPVNNLKVSGANTKKDPTKGLVACTDGVSAASGQDTNGNFNALGEEVFVFAPFYGVGEKSGNKQAVNMKQSEKSGYKLVVNMKESEKSGYKQAVNMKQTEKSGYKQAVNMKQSQRIRTPDYSDELHQSSREFKNSNVGGERSPVVIAGSIKNNAVDEARSENQELQNLEEKLLGNMSAKTSGSLSEIKGYNPRTSLKGDDQMKDISPVNSARSSSNTDAENVMLARLKHQLDSVMGMRSVEAKGNKSSSPSVDPRDHEQPKTMVYGAPVRPSEGQNTVSPRQFNVAEPTRTNSKRNAINARKSTSEVTELKPDFRQNKQGGSAQLSGNHVVKCKSEPQLYVKPEEVSKTLKQASKFFTSKVLTPLSTSIITKQVDVPALGSKSSSQNIPHSDSVGQEPRNKMQLPGRKGKDNDTLKKSSQGQTGNALLADTDGLPLLNENIPLSELFRQMQQRNNAATVNSNKATRQFVYKDTNSNKRTVVDKELTGKLQEQWSKDFRDKYRKPRQTSVYSPYLQSNTNCLVAKSEDCNTSSGNTGDSSGNHPAPEVKTILTSSPSSTEQLPSKKKNHLPTMGMAQRLLAASEKPPSALETSKAPPEITFSDTSMATDVPTTQGSAEIDDLPDVDQFEEWIQNNMPEVYTDKKAKTSLGKDIESPPRQRAPDSLRLPNTDKSRSPSVSEGSPVDGLSYLKMAEKYSNSYAYAEGGSEERLHDNLTSEEKVNDGYQYDKVKRNISVGGMPKRNTLSPDSYRFNPRNVTDTAARIESLTDSSKQRKSRSGNKQQSGNDVLSAASESDTISTWNKDDISSSTLNTSNAQNTGIDSMFRNAKVPNAFRSMDGFMSMTLVPEKPPANTLKSTLKRSKSRDRSEEKRVSFDSKSSKNDNCRTTCVKGRQCEKARENFGSSVDNPSLETNFVGDQVTGESDLRKDLAEERKRSEIEARMKLISGHTKQIREYEAVLFKYSDIIGKIKDDAKGVVRYKDTQPKTTTEI